MHYIWKSKTFLCSWDFLGKCVPHQFVLPQQILLKNFFKIIDEEKVLLILFVPSQESVLTNVHTHFQGSIKPSWKPHNSGGPQILVTFSRQEWNVGFPDILSCLLWTQQYIGRSYSHFTFYILDNTYILLELSTFYILDNIFNQVGAGLMVHPRLSAATAFYSLPLISKTQECCTSRCVRFSTQVLCSVSNTFQKTSVVLTFQHFLKHKCCVLFPTQQHSSLTLYSLPGRVCNACY